MVVLYPMGFETLEVFSKKFKKRVLEEYSGNLLLDVFRFDSDRQPIIKSNPFAVVLAKEISQKWEIHPPTLSQLEFLFKQGICSGDYDSALILRGEDDKYYPENNPLARDIYPQIQRRGILASSENPIVIPLMGLRLVNAENEYGLSFELVDGVELIEAPALIGKNHCKNFIGADERGIPILSENGYREIYTREGVFQLL